MTKHPRLNNLVWLSVMCADNSNGVFDCNMVALGQNKAHKKSNGIITVFHSFDCLVSVFLDIKPTVSGNRKKCARRMCNNQIPSPPLFVALAVHRLKRTIAIQQRQNIALNVPFRMTAGTRLNVARKRQMTTLTKSHANALRFFTGNQYVHHAPTADISAANPYSTPNSAAQPTRRIFQPSSI